MRGRIGTYSIIVAASLTVLMIYGLMIFSIEAINTMEQTIQDLESELALLEEANRSLNHHNEILNDILKNR